MGWGSCTSHHPGRFGKAVAPGHASGFFPLGKNVDRFGSDFNTGSIPASQQHRFLLLAAIAAHEKFPPDLRRFLLTVGRRAGRVPTALTRMALDSLLQRALGGMFVLDVATYPASPHIERPGVRYQGEWLSSFLWIRDHTPKDAVFALDPDYLSKSGVDLHGFRAIAERSALADQEKDSGAASVFPELAERWKQQSAAQFDWAHVSEARLRDLHAQYGVSWVLLENPAALGGVVCPYRNGGLRVCRIVDERGQFLGRASIARGIGYNLRGRTMLPSIVNR